MSIHPPGITPSNAAADTEGTAIPNNATQLEQIQLEEQRRQLLQELESRQNLLGGILAGLVAAVAMATVWAAISYATNYQIGWMAVAVGFAVGYAMRQVGRGVTPIFGIAGAALSLLGCVLGNILYIAVLLADYQEAELLQVLQFFVQVPDLVWEMLRASTTPIDFLFYALAIYQGYRGSTIRIE